LLPLAYNFILTLGYCTSPSLLLDGHLFGIHERGIMETEDRISKLEEKVERLLTELAEIRQTSGRAFEVNKMINISDEGKGKDK